MTVEIGAAGVPVGQTAYVVATPEFGERIAVTSEALTTATAAIDPPPGNRVLPASVAFTLDENEIGQFSSLLPAEEPASHSQWEPRLVY